MHGRVNLFRHNDRDTKSCQCKQSSNIGPIKRADDNIGVRCNDRVT